MNHASEGEKIFRARVNQETARIAWQELLRFFAAGTVISVDAELDLVDVAFQISQDNRAQVEAWMTEGMLAKVSDALAREWLDEDAMLWAVVVKPWILVQHSSAS